MVSLKHKKYTKQLDAMQEKVNTLRKQVNMPQKRLKGLFVNQRKTQCSIYESGLMIKNALSNNPNFELDYVETTSLFATKEPYDFCIVNWHYITLPISKINILKLPGLKIGVNLEVSLTNYMPFTPLDWFDAYMIMDPTKSRIGNLFPFPRPLEVVSNLRNILDDKKIVVGSFGFCGNKDKRFEEVIEYFNKSNEECIIRFNFPPASYIRNNLLFIKAYAEQLKSLVKSKNIDLRITHDYMPKEELIRWCSEHTINIFPYYRKIPGLAAVTDQAIVAGRAIAVTDSETFRHLHKYISYYPKQSYNELMVSTLDGIKQMQIDWHKDKFNEKFNELLIEKGI